MSLFQKFPEFDLVKLILSEGRINFTKSYLKTALTKNPFYPSVRSISETLTLYNIPNIVVTAPIETIVEQQAFPFATLLQSDNENKWVLVKNISNDNVEYYDVNERRFHLNSEREFLKEWTGVSLIFEALEDGSEPFFEENKKRAKIERVRNTLTYLSLGGLLFSIFILISQHSSYSFIGLTFLNFCGLFISSLLVFKKEHGNTSFLNRVCKNGKNGDCDKVIFSKASSFFGVYDFTELGLIYFLTTFLLSIAALFPINSLILYTLYWLAFTTCIYSVYSIYYQVYVIKSWCLLCMAIQIIFLCEFAILHSLISNVEYVFTITQVNIIISVSAFSLLLWEFLLKKMVWAYAHIEHVERQYKLLKSNKEVFNYLQTTSTLFTHSLNKKLGFYFNNPNASNTLMCFLSPTCSPCQLQYKLIKRLFLNNDDCHVIIYLTYKNTKDKSIIRDLLCSAVDKYKKLDDWFYEKKLTNVNEIEPKALDEYFIWLESLNIDSTPKIYFNNRLLTSEYNLYDVAKFI